VGGANDDGGTMTAMANMAKLEEIVARLPEAGRVDIEAWGGEPTFRVHGKSFVFSSPDAGSIGVKLPYEEAVAVVASDAHAKPMGYGLGRHGWVSISIPKRTSARRWREIEEWIRTSYTLVAPTKLARLVIAEDSV
jgi:predicted DNA-binding protein (MmcQ/YjbR family)